MGAGKGFASLGIFSLEGFIKHGEAKLWLLRRRSMGSVRYDSDEKKKTKNGKFLSAKNKLYAAEQKRRVLKRIKPVYIGTSKNLS